jgi:inner membrane protein
MPSILSHPAVPLAIGLGLGSRIISPRLLLAGVAASIVPDVDVYLEHVSSAIGHRGLTHTLLFALCGGLFAALISAWLHASRPAAFAFVSLATLSHPLLDMCTNGGSGIPLFWPLTHERFFMPWTPIEVSPLGVARFFSERGAEVLASEAVWVWAPAVVVAAVLLLFRRVCASAPRR